MKNLNQYLNESMIMELSSQLLGKASKLAKEKGRNAQSNRFAVAAGKALEKELKGWKPGPDAKNCGKVVDTIKDMTENNPAMKALAKAEPASKVSVIKFPVLKGGINGPYKFIKWRDVKIPKAKFYIYKDEYHHALHIGTLSDLLGLLGSAYYDFEDFDASYIVKSFDNIKDAVKYAKNAKNTGKRVYDSDKFMDGVMDGKYTDDDLYWDGPGDAIISIISMWADVEDLPDDWHEKDNAAYN